MRTINLIKVAAESIRKNRMRTLLAVLWCRGNRPCGWCVLCKDSPIRHRDGAVAARSVHPGILADLRRGRARPRE